MILHCVFLRLKAAVTAAEKQALYDEVAGLKATIDGIVDVKSGPNVSPEVLNGGFVDGICVTFETPEARDAYLIHPDHVAVGQKIIAACDGGLSGLLVFDMNI